MSVYLLIEGQTTYQLQKAVQDRIDMGFEPIGGIAIEIIDAGGFGLPKKVFHQAMIREDINSNIPF